MKDDIDRLAQVVRDSAPHDPGGLYWQVREAVGAGARISTAQALEAIRHYAELGVPDDIRQYAATTLRELAAF